ncbi:unnamed protein product [Heligmosomoides polygyrus]|uniref:Uncharacterized protein n=1 Tax=Heligmosomoides polygyrus TaxID=6339 RepID=A0A183FKW3_HELPZ|nr:unnamed protein product [Heligmosomoides polygyrus]
MIGLGFRRYLSMVGVDRVRESLQSEAVIGVGRKPSEIGERVVPERRGHQRRMTVIQDWSIEVGGQPSSSVYFCSLMICLGFPRRLTFFRFQSDVVIGVGGQPSKIGTSEWEDSHKFG